MAGLKSSVGMVGRSAWISAHIFIGFIRVAAAALSGRTRGGSQPLMSMHVTSTLESLGGAFPKVGQLLATRVDVLPAEWCSELGRLQTHVSPMKARTLTHLLESSFPRWPFATFDTKPIGSGAIAQVHRATRRDDGREVAVKILRPENARRLKDDAALANQLARIVSRHPRVQMIPIREVVRETADRLLQQTDFVREAHHLRMLGAVFRDVHDVVVPAVHGDLCRRDVLCMDYIGGLRKVTDPSVPKYDARRAVVATLRALYRMIFREGIVHCDLHPGNALVASDGRAVILDAGLMARLDDTTRRRFADFFLAIAFADGPRAARIVRETAHRLPADLDIVAFDGELAALVQRVGGLNAREFQVTRFVADLFAIQRRYGIYGTSQFAAAIQALLVYEGTVKGQCPDIDFQREAAAFIVAAAS